MDEFELFKARASGCEITLQDFDKLSKVSNGAREDSAYEQEKRKSKNGSRHSSRKNSKNKQDQKTETHLDVTVEIQPPSPILDGKKTEDNEFDDTQLNQQITKSNSQKERRKSQKRNSVRRSRHSLRSDEAASKDLSQLSNNNLTFNGVLQSETSLQNNTYKNDEVINEEETNPQAQTIYRVRSFTTKKGEIVSRGDSFKAYGRRNSNFLTVKNNPSFRRSSEAVPSMGSNLLVTSLQTGSTCRRSSFTCLPQNNAEFLMDGGRRKSSFGSRLASSGNIKQGSLHSNSAKLLNAIDQVSNLSLEGSVLEEETIEEMVDEAEEPIQEFQVAVLGSTGVGKSTLINQLMTSEYLANKENHEQELEEERVISVMLNEIETAIQFYEIPFQQPMTILPDPLPDAYLLIFSVTEQSTFAFIKNAINYIHENDSRFIGCEFKQEKAIISKGCPFVKKQHVKSRKEILETHVNSMAVSPDLDEKFQKGNEERNINEDNAINDGVKILAVNDGNENIVVLNKDSHKKVSEDKSKAHQSKPVILVLANKQDLVRNRTVSEADVKKLTTSMRCREAEVSALLDLNVDEVLVDLVKWLRRQGSSQLSRIDSGEEEYGEGKGCFQRAMSGLCGNIFG